MVIRVAVDLLMLGVSAYFFFAAGSFGVRAPRGDFGPAFFPRVMAVGLLILAAVHLYRTLRLSTGGAERTQAGEGAPAGSRAALAVWLESLGIPASTLILILMTFVYLLLLPHLGFLATTLAYTLAMMTLYGVRRLRTLLLAGVAGVLVTYYIFARLLQVPLP